MTKSAIAVPSLALGQVSTVKILGMCFHNFHWIFGVFFRGGITLGHCGQSSRCSQHRSWQDCTGVIIKSRKCIEKKKKRIECSKFVLYQPCKGHSSHARQQHQKASGLVLLGKDAPDHLVALYQLILKRWWPDHFTKGFWASDTSSPDIWRWSWSQLPSLQTRRWGSKSPWHLSFRSCRP